MATVDQLLAALYQRSCKLDSPDHLTAEEAFRGWHRLAHHGTRILDMVGYPPDLASILREIVRSDELQDAQASAPIAALGYTVGVLADTLVSYPEQVAIAGQADRAQLRSCIVGCLHVAARSTLSAQPEDANTAGAALVRSLAAATEAAWYVPWRPLRPALGQLALGPNRSNLDKALTAWAESAIDVLNSSTRVTSYAFQRTAGSIARICLTAAQSFSKAGERIFADEEMAVALSGAFQSWQIAADWPLGIRLGGRNADLRHRSQELDDVLERSLTSGEESWSPQQWVHGALRQAQEVAAIHESGLERLVSSRGLWIIADALDASYLARNPGTHRTDWVPDSGRGHGATLLLHVHRAIGLLQHARAQVEESRFWDLPASPPLHASPWETVSVPSPTATGDRAYPSQNVKAMSR